MYVWQISPGMASVDIRITIADMCSCNKKTYTIKNVWQTLIYCNYQWGDKTNLELGALRRPTLKVQVGVVFSRPLGCYCVAKRKKKEQVPNLPWASPGREWHPRLVHLCGYPRIIQAWALEACRSDKQNF